MYKNGVIVLVPFPFTDLTGSKIRPAVIISQNLPGDDVVVVFITSKSGAGKFDVKIKASERNGLKINSFIKCSKMATLDKKIVLGELGIIESGQMKNIKKALKSIFGL
ncbi:MAG: type II toxin-antitoxin system PemK/MazF family toxin [Patescibacteria group bacterium]